MAIGFGCLFIGLSLYIDEYLALLGILILSIFAGYYTKTSFFSIINAFICIFIFFVVWHKFIQPMSLRYAIVFISGGTLLCGIPGFISTDVIKIKNRVKKLVLAGSGFGIILVLIDNGNGISFLSLSGISVTSLSIGLISEKKAAPFFFVFPCFMILQLSQLKYYIS